MDENYFTTIRHYGEIYSRKDQMGQLKYELDFDHCKSWCKDNPELDACRQAAKNAIEAYYNALERYIDKENDRLYDKLDDSDRVINWSNLFKKLGHR